MPPCFRPTRHAPSAIERVLNAEAAITALAPGSDALSEFNEFRASVWSLVSAGDDPAAFTHAWHLLVVVCQRELGELACGDATALERLKAGVRLVVQHLPG